MYINWSGDRVTIELDAETEAIPLLGWLQRLPLDNALVSVLRQRLEHWNNQRGYRKKTTTWSNR